ncbi:MAG: hypothetical protein GXP50_03430 [Deltaproteobacteria bacterium]|nr:hypothetical protein [Deltaproteobacteria bacterium]
MLRRLLGFLGLCLLAGWAGLATAAVEVEVTAEGVGASTTSPVVVVEHVELRFPNGTGRQTVAKDEPGLYAEALFRYQGNGTLRIQWIVDGRILVETVETLTFGTDLVTRSDKSGVSLPTFEPGPHTVTLTFDNGSGQAPALEVPEITYFVAERVPPSRRPGIRLAAPAEGEEVDPRLLAFVWRPVDAPPGFFDRFRVEVTPPPTASVKGTAGKGRSWSGTGPVLAAEVTEPRYLPPVGQAVSLAPGRYRWKVVGFPADGSTAVVSDWREFRLGDPPPEGGVFFRSVRVTGAPAGERVGVVEAPLERLTQSLDVRERTRVPAGAEAVLRVRVENSSFQERQALRLEVYDIGSGLVSMTGLPPLPACGSPVPSGAVNPWLEQSEYLTQSGSLQGLQEELDQTRARLECRGSFAELSVPWTVPLIRERGELILSIKDGPVVLDTARLTWRAEPAQGAGGFDFSESQPLVALKPERRFPDGRPTYLDMAGFRIEVGEYDAVNSPVQGLSGRGLVRWRGDSDRTPIPVTFEGVQGDPTGDPLVWRVTRGLASLQGDPVTIRLSGHTVRIQGLTLEPDRARADVAVVLTAIKPWSSRFPVWVGAREVPVLNGGEFVTEAAVPPGTVLPGNEPPPGTVATYLPVDVFAGGSALVMDFSPHLGYGPAADEPEWTGLALVSALVRVPVQALDDVLFTDFDEALLGLFDTREEDHIYGRAPFLRVSPAGSVSAEGVELLPAARVPPDLLRGDPQGEMVPLSLPGFRIGFSGGTFDLADGGVGGLDLAGWIRLPQDLGGGTLTFRHLRRGDPEGATLRGFHTEPITRDLPAVTIDGFTYRPAQARLVLPGGAATVRSIGAAFRNPPLFTWPTNEDEFQEQAELLRDAYARGPGLHLEGGSFAAARAWSRKVGAFDGRVENLLLRMEESALVENRARGVIRVPPPADLTLAFEGSVDADGSILVPEDGLLAPPAEGGWPLDYWRVTLRPGEYYVESGPREGHIQGANVSRKGKRSPSPQDSSAAPKLSASRPQHMTTDSVVDGVARDPLGNPTGPPERKPEPDAGGTAASGGTPQTADDGGVADDVARRLGNTVDADEGFGQGAGSGGWGMGPSGDRQSAGGEGSRASAGPQGPGPDSVLGEANLGSQPMGYDVEMDGKGARARGDAGVGRAQPGWQRTAGAKADRGTSAAGGGLIQRAQPDLHRTAGAEVDTADSAAGGSGYDIDMGATSDEGAGPEGAGTASVGVTRSPWDLPPLSDGAFVIDGPLEEGGLRGFWLYMDRPDPARTADYGPARGVVFDTDRIEIRGAGITFDVPPELGGPEFGVASVRAEVLGSLTRAGAPQWQIPPEGPSGTGGFRITLDIFPDGNIGYNGDPGANPRVEPVGPVGFLGIPFTPSGEVRFARYAPPAAAAGGNPTDAVADAAPTSALGLRTDRAAAAGVAAATPLVTFEGTLHFPFFGTRRARIQHTASGARVPFLSGPEQSCADLICWRRTASTASPGAFRSRWATGWESRWSGSGKDPRTPRPTPSAETPAGTWWAGSTCGT